MEISMEHFGEKLSYLNRKSITWKFACNRLDCLRMIETVCIGE